MFLSQLTFNQKTSYGASSRIRIKCDLFPTNIQLENDYLSSPDKLLEYQILYFDDELIKKDIQTLKKIEINNDKIVITNFTLQKN